MLTSSGLFLSTGNIGNVLIKFTQLSKINNEGYPVSSSGLNLLCSSSLPAILLLGLLSDGLHRHPSSIIVSAILGPISPRLAQVELSSTPYLIYSPCSASKTFLANKSAVTLCVYNSL